MTRRAQREALVHMLGELVDDLPVLVCRLDRDGRYTLVAGAALEAFPVSADAFVGRTYEEVFAGNAEVLDACRRALGGQRVSTVVTTRYGVWEIRMEPVFDDRGALDGIVAAGLDATDRSRAAEALAASEARFQALVRNISDVISVHDRGGVISYITPSAGRILGIDEDAELLGTTLEQFVHPDDRERVRAAFRAWVHDRHEPVRYRVRAADRSWRHVESHGVNLLDDPAVQGAVVTTIDITERQRVEDELTRRALIDSLTGLANRTLLVDRISHALAREQRGEGRSALLFLDLDGFKIVNDTAGHAAGDALLVEVARRVRSVVRPGDTVARFGGDEFAVLCEDVAEPALPLNLAQRIADSLRRPIDVDGTPMHVSASIGVAMTPVPDASTLLRHADVAMYRAKERGRARFEVFDDALADAATHRLQVQNELRRALASEELVVHYQPIIDLRTRHPVGAEALVRWAHPDGGLREPAGFMPGAEDSGLVVPIGEWVLEAACREAATWPAAAGGAPPYVSVNLSARQLSERTLVAQVAGALERSGLTPDRLVLEVTETGAMGDPEAAIATLERLRSLGVRLAVDDFGTGQSSLAYLKRLPVDVVKIDRAFVDGLGSDRDDTVIVSAVASMAHALGLAVVGEGVEQEIQAEELSRLGCHQAQGHLWARAVSGGELRQRLLDLADDARHVTPVAVPPGGTAAVDDPSTMPRAIFDGIEAPMAVLDRSGRILTTNLAWKQLALAGGSALADAVRVGASYLDVCRASDPDQPLAPAAEGIAGVLDGSLPGFDLEYAEPTAGARRWFTLRATPVPLPVGGAIVTHRESTSRREDDEARGDQEATYRSAFAVAPVGLAVADLDGRILHVNTAFADLVHVVADDLRGAALDDVLPPDDSDKDRARLDALLAGTAGTYTGRRRYVAPDGTVGVVRVSVTMVCDAAGLPRLILSTVDPD